MQPLITQLSVINWATGINAIMLLLKSDRSTLNSLLGRLMHSPDAGQLEGTSWYSYCSIAHRTKNDVRKSEKADADEFCCGNSTHLWVQLPIEYCSHVTLSRRTWCHDIACMIEAACILQQYLGSKKRLVSGSAAVPVAAVKLQIQGVE